MDHRQLDLSLLITEQDILPLLKQFEDAGWAIEEDTLMDIARDNASSNHWKDKIWQYLQSKKVAEEASAEADHREEENKTLTIQKPKTTRRKK